MPRRPRPRNQTILFLPFSRKPNALTVAREMAAHAQGICGWRPTWAPTEGNQKKKIGTTTWLLMSKSGSRLPGGGNFLERIAARLIWSITHNYIGMRSVWQLKVGQEGCVQYQYLYGAHQCSSLLPEELLDLHQEKNYHRPINGRPILHKIATSSIAFDLK